MGEGPSQREGNSLIMQEARCTTCGGRFGWNGCKNGLIMRSKKVAVLFPGVILRKSGPGLALLFLILTPGSAWALQTHGAPEGIIVHQMAHVFYLAALIYLFWDVRRTFSHGRGWRFLRVFCVLMMGWNVLAFTGHLAALMVEKSDFFNEFGYLSSGMLGPFSWVKLSYYFARLDHLILVPALLFLFLSLRAIYRDAIQGHGEES